MAANNNSPSGFSYAQAARGRSSAGTSQTTSSKVTSGTATPATGALSDVAPTSNWADDVEASVATKSVESPKVQQSEVKSPQPNIETNQHSSSEEKTSNGTSAISSPELPASSSSTTKEDDSSSAPNASSSESTWDTKSQASEPSWIAERKERQSGSQSSDSTVKAEKKAKDVPAATTPSPSASLYEAPPPPVNPWAKRAEDAKARMATLTKPAPAPASATNSASLKENQRPRADSRRKANSIAGLPREFVSTTNDDAQKAVGSQAKRSADARNSNLKQNSKVAANGARTDSLHDGSGKSMPSDRQSLPNLTAAPPPVKDEISWPTPDTAQEKERNETQEKETEEKPDDETTPSTKRKKPEWKPMPVVPTVIWQTQSMNEPRGGKSRNLPGGDRGSRGGNGARGRGNHRATPSGINGVERATVKSTSSSDGYGTGPTTAPDTSSFTSAPDGAYQKRKAPRASSASPQRQVNGSSNGQTSHDTQPVEANASGVNYGMIASGTVDSRPSYGTRRSASPKKAGTSATGQNDDDMVPKPIPRPTSIGTQTEENSQYVDSSSNRTGPPIRRVPSDSRKDSRTFEGYRDPTWTGPTRGNKARGGRGRGGNTSRDYTTGHAGSNGYVNGYAPEHAAASQYAVPQSPSMYSAQRGNHQFTYGQLGRGGHRGNPRSQSIPIDNSFYQRFAGAQPPPHALQTGYVPGMYEMNGHAFSPVGYQPQMDGQYLMEMVVIQLDYYFSIDNLLKDMFLRKHMDSQGFVFLDVVASFNRVKQLTQDKDLLKNACMNSQIIEIRIGEDGKERLRKREGWDQFLLPMEQREPAAQTNGPERLERPEPPQLSINSMSFQPRGPASAGMPPAYQRLDRRSYDSGYSAMNGAAATFGGYNGFPEATYGESTNGEEARGRAAKSPIHETSISPSKSSLVGAVGNDADTDSFSDEQLISLTVVVKVNPQKPPHHSAASRTFSNGSIDSRSILTEIERPMEKPATRSQSTMSGETLVDGSESSSDLSRVASPSNAPSHSRPTPNSEVALFWVKEQDKDIPVERLPQDLTSEPYVQLRHKALDQRNGAATGTCPYDLDVLYQFWCHFLIRNFNNRMYDEFKYYANEDAKERHSHTGLQNLRQFYSQSLSSLNPIRERVVKDYVELVKNEPKELEGQAFKTLRAAWRNGALNLKNRKKLSDVLDDDLKEKLDKSDT